MAWGVHRRSRVCASLLFLSILERVLFFYSPALWDIEDEMYFFSTAKLVAYGSQWATPEIVMPLKLDG